ncbi:hypothetical protein [Actinacidiphila bryophytorum]|uniref:hypothetical protein n=1 Tax=Actinacidiphila bryophytorum TaxID=1436133 RepID=UPI002176E4DC|nr:hypothetical protein [Actinacidiphila bryophytorum]UWE12507.1 hypothetical protein NYE86_30020 [Actinacidiphila bryophytorum]
MRKWHHASLAVALAATAAVVLAGCGGGSGSKDDKPAASSKASASKGGGKSDHSAGDPPSASPTAVLAQIKGEAGMTVTINTASRDAGGFVTVQGVITNNGDEAFDAVDWRGQETELVASGPSVAGAVLVDPEGKKRYYVLRDTGGMCLCTMGLVDIEPKETRPFFAQFPSPPPTTTQVEFELPTMPPAKISISEG